jgi:Ca-activated chloride channel family protein
MSFASPLWLLTLLLIPLALSAWVLRRSRPSSYAVRFTALPALREAVAQTGLAGRSLRPFIPVGLMLAALAALVLALAKPQRTVAVPIERATIMLVTDHSRSMESDDVAPDRLSAAQAAARTFLKQLPKQVRVGVVAFSTAPDAVQAPTTDHSAVQRIIDAQFPDGATATGDALTVALAAIDSGRKGVKRPPAAIVLLSDGKTTTGRDPVGVAIDAGRLKVPIYTVALGTSEGVVTAPGYGGYIPVPPDPQTLGAIAQESGGKAFTAQDQSRLSSIYKNLGSKLGTKKHKREATAAFALAGALLLLAAAATSVRFSPALP